MSEETNVDHNDGTWSGLKKTIIGTVSTIVLGGGTYVGTLLFGGKEEAPAPAAVAPVINITNSNQQSQAAGKTVIINQKSAEPAKPAAPVKKKEGDEFKEKPAQW